MGVSPNSCYLFWGPHKKHYSSLGSIFISGSHYFGATICAGVNIFLTHGAVWGTSFARVFPYHRAVAFLVICPSSEQQLLLPHQNTFHPGSYGDENFPLRIPLRKGEKMTSPTKSCAWAPTAICLTVLK